MDGIYGGKQGQVIPTYLKHLNTPSVLLKLLLT